MESNEFTLVELYSTLSLLVQAVLRSKDLIANQIVMSQGILKSTCLPWNKKGNIVIIPVFPQTSYATAEMCTDAL